ncbi:MAG TPA: hypothetical protein VHY19_06480 [Steroidobacteraceae bacterium]|jgi:transposase-like protein|nr:hypothetical protein [Steroidobacteraceae bacterium]
MASKLPWPFMVFREQVPELAPLADPKTSPEERERILREVKAAQEVVQRDADRNTQRARHADSHERRAKVIADLRRDANGKPLRGEPKRLAAEHHVDVAQVRKWIEQLRRSPPGSLQGLTSVQAYAYGQMIRNRNRAAARRKPKA